MTENTEGMEMSKETVKAEIAELRRQLYVSHIKRGERRRLEQIIMRLEETLSNDERNQQ